MKYALIFLLLLLMPLAVSAKEDVYQPPQEFVEQAFGGKVPTPTSFVLPEELQPTVNKIMRHRYPVRGVRYWRDGNRTVWILEEIGKYKPITTGIIVNDGQIETVKVLIYRETHGWEVRYPSFTDQFKEAKLNGRRLDRRIDGISGATLSVKALTRLSQLALFFHQQVVNHG